MGQNPVYQITHEKKDCQFFACLPRIGMQQATKRKKKTNGHVDVEKKCQKKRKTKMKKTFEQN